jgi:hypothetical protein
MHATERVVALAGFTKSVTEGPQMRQAILLRRLERVPVSRLLVYEAMTMKEYWGCYYLALASRFQRFGPRKKARFVREFVSDPEGRARGCTAVDAAINYVHQKRLFKARSATSS